MSQAAWVAGLALLIFAAGYLAGTRQATLQRLWRVRRRGRRPVTGSRAMQAARAEDAAQRPHRNRNNPPDLRDLEVSDVMVHRTSMRSINADDPPEAILRAVIQSPHTHVPLWRGSLDNIVGVLHATDVLRALGEVGFDLARIDVAKTAARPWFVPDTTRLDVQLRAFLRKRSHFAIVVDEYGEVEGLTTLEDIIGKIVGDLADEDDVDIQGVRKEADGSVVVDGSVVIRDLNRALGWALPEGEATTVAGLVIHEAQLIPEEKQAFTFHGKRFIILKRDKNRIARVRIRAAQEPVATRPAPSATDGARSE